jgi:hypothetical protein
MMAKLVIIPTTVGFMADTLNKLNRLLKQPRLIIAGGHHLVCITIMNMGLVMKTGLVIYHYMLYTHCSGRWGMYEFSFGDLSVHMYYPARWLPLILMTMFVWS